MARPRAALAIAAISIIVVAVLVLLSRDWATGVSSGGQPAGSLLSVESFRLENGLEVVMVPIAGTTKVAVMAWYGVGSADDPADLPGLAHYVEHVTFSALGAHKPRARSSRRAETEPEAFTAYDHTAYYHVVSKEQLALALRTEADRLARLRIDDAAVEEERQAVIDERRHDIDGDVHALLEEKLQSVVFSGSPYGRPVVPPEIITWRVRAQDAKRFWEEWYKPSNLVLVVAGAIDSETLRPLVEANFGNIDAEAAQARKRPAPIRPLYRRIAIETDASAGTLWARMFVAPSFATDPGESLSLQLLARILANGRTGRLDRTIVGQQRVAQEVTIEYEPDAVGDTSFIVHAKLARRSDIARFESAFDAELANIAAGGVSPDELAKARELAILHFMAAWSDPLEAASLIGAARVAGRSVDDVINWPQSLLRITPEDVRVAAAKLSTTVFEATGVARGSAR